MLLQDTEKAAIPPSDVEAPGINMLPYLLLPLAGPEEYDLEVSSPLLTSGNRFDALCRWLSNVAPDIIIPSFDGQWAFGWGLTGNEWVL